MRLTRSLFVASLAFGLTACAGSQRTVHDVPISVSELTTAHIRNVNAFPVTIYLTQPGMRHRLGVVESMSNEMFMVPPEVLDGRLQFRLVASPLGPHPTYVSETFMLQPGQSADWRLQESSRTSSLSLVSVQ